MFKVTPVDSKYVEDILTCNQFIIKFAFYLYICILMVTVYNNLGVFQ